jgi:hypothetical protein
MDPILLGIIKTLVPVLVTLGLAVIPLGIIWLVKHHQFRMKELEIEGQRLTSPSMQQLAAIEARLSAIEAALHLPEHNPLASRAAMLEGPATSQAQEPQAARLRER